MTTGKQLPVTSPLRLIRHRHCDQRPSKLSYDLQLLLLRHCPHVKNQYRLLHLLLLLLLMLPPSVHHPHFLDQRRLSLAIEEIVAEGVSSAMAGVSGFSGQRLLTANETVQEEEEVVGEPVEVKGWNLNY